MDILSDQRYIDSGMVWDGYFDLRKSCHEETEAYSLEVVFEGEYVS